MTPTPAAAVTIEPNIDAYGRRARASALADFVEAAALAGLRITRAALEDLVSENEWVSRPTRQSWTVGDPREDPATWAEATFELLAERETLLGSHYPFSQSGQALVVTSKSFDPRQSGYVSLLAVTMVHAWSIPTGVSPEAALEAIVVAVLRMRGMSAVGIGATERQSGFVAALQSGAAALGLRASDDPRPRSRWAKDAGVDTLAGVVWGDGRQAGEWIMIGQATVGSSNAWRAKLLEPDPAIWAKYLNEPLFPQAFLAVPHHAEQEALSDLTASQRGLVLDRLRLIPAKPANTPEEISLIEALLAARVSL